MENLICKKFGRLTIIEVLEKKIPNTARRCVAVCECGTTKEFSLSKVKTGHTRSCSCIYKDAKSHGMTGTKIDKIYYNMQSRCYNPKKEQYKYYGGRGIKICVEWLSDKTTFFKWAVENGFEENLQIDRKDNNADYSPSNCRWITSKENCNNTRNNVFITHRGETKTISQWADFAGINYYTFIGRLKNGWQMEKVIETPVRVRLKNLKL